MTGTDWVVQSPAKINWTLRVIRRREDGFHEIESLITPVSLYDELAFARQSEPGFKLTCDRPGLPTNDRNLIVQAAAIMAMDAPGEFGLACRLTKRIPTGGGLGGGSSNAAATLKALNRIWSLDWPMDRLRAAAAKLGSDVPLFLEEDSVVITGRGEKVRPVALGWRGYVVLMLPDFAVSTADVYRAWRAQEGLLPIENLEAEGLGRSDGAVGWMKKTYNMLERPAMEVCPKLRDIVARARALASREVRVSGSGSTLFTAFDTQVEAQTFAESAAQELRLDACVVQPVEQA